MMFAAALVGPGEPQRPYAFEYMCRIWTREPGQFALDALQQIPGLNIWLSHGAKSDFTERLGIPSINACWLEQHSNALRMSMLNAASSIVDEVEASISVGSAEKRLETIKRVTDLFLASADKFDSEQIELFDVTCSPETPPVLS